MKFLFRSTVIFLLSLLIFSCTSVDSGKKFKEPELSLIFAGDIMAHTPNFSMKDFSIIWDDIREEVSDCDIAFANIEAPVDDSIPFESYPTFNMNSSYPIEAIKAGFNLFSLANNHTNDKGSSGIQATAKWAARIENETRHGVRPVYFSGLQEKNDFSYRTFYFGQWKILFIAATELLNTWANYSEINYYAPNQKGRTGFLNRVKTLKEKENCDLFIVSIHTSESEYVLTVEPKVNQFYHDLLENGADIVVSNHPHVIRPVEFIGSNSDNKIRKVIMYANGNTISSQRRKLDFENPAEIWQYTGDGELVKLILKFDENGFYLSEKNIQYITTYSNGNDLVIRKLNETFFNELDSDGKSKLSKYFRERKKLLENIKGIYTWQ